MFNWLADSDASYRWGQVVICLIVLFFTCLVLFGCGDDEAQRKLLIAEQNAKIAHACIPAPGEQRILQWAVVEDKQVLYLTIREPLAPRPNRPVQFVVTSEQELIP